MITVHIMHTQTLVRQGLSQLLTKVPGISISGESRSIAELFQAIRRGIKVDVMLIALPVAELENLDYSQVKKLTGARVLLMAFLEDNNCVSHALQPGADGYILADTNPDELIFAINYILEGKRYMASPIGFLLQKKARVSLQPAARIELSSREAEILNLIGEGLTNQEIADKLFTSRRTVEGHRNNLLHKTGTRNTAALIKFVMSGNILNYD